jgi:hypothetical protein
MSTRGSARLRVLNLGCLSRHGQKHVSIASLFGIGSDYAMGLLCNAESAGRQLCDRPPKLGQYRFPAFPVLQGWISAGIFSAAPLPAKGYAQLNNARR